MGSVLYKHYEREQEREQERILEHRKSKLKEISKIIKKTSVNGKDYKMIEFIWENREKIYNNKKLIDLLG